MKIVIMMTDMTSLAIENKLRRATKGQLLALQVLAESPNSLATTSQMQEALYSQLGSSNEAVNQSVGGTISAVSRLKVEGQPLLVPMGKDNEEGIRWKLNEDIIEKDKFEDIIKELLMSWL